MRAARMREAGVDRGVLAEVARQAQAAHFGMQACKLVDALPGIIRAAVVDEQDLEVLGCGKRALAAFHQFLQAACATVDG